MLPPGMSFNAVSDKALEAHRSAGMGKSVWNWAPILKANENGFWPYTPGTNLLYAGYLGGVWAAVTPDGRKAADNP